MKLDSSQSIFFPKALGARLEAYSSFPLTWWGTLVFDAKTESDLKEAATVCKSLRERAAELVASAQCDEDPTAFLPMLKDWARDGALRSDKIDDGALVVALRGALTKASLPIDPKLLSLLRFDPLENYRELKKLAEERPLLKLKRTEGLFYEPNSKRAVIPLKFNFPSEDGAKTARFFSHLEALTGAKRGQWELVGMHGSALSNRRQIQKDLTLVSSLGMGALALLFALVIFFKRAKLLWLVPIVLLAVGISAGLTALFFGGVHGLTFSFGVGIVGLALDYGLHRALNAQTYVWRSNFFGLLTTVGVLSVLALSAIPLIRQLMVFSALGISFAFLLLYFFDKRFGLVSGVSGFGHVPKPGRVKAAASLLLALGVPVGVVFSKPNWDLASFNFQTPREKEAMSFFLNHSGLKPPLFRILSANEKELEDAHKTLAWAISEKIAVQNAASFFPTAQTQRANLATWVGSPCDDGPKSFSARLKRMLSADERTFFAPFFSAKDCARLHPRGIAVEDPPAYAADLYSRGQWLTLFFTDDEGLKKVKKRFSDATSLKDLASEFPRLLTQEIRWMAPLSFFLVGLILFAHYRNIRFALLAFIPFLTGAGLVIWASLLFGPPLSFVSLVGLIMLYGLSVDYGIFATDATRLPGEAAQAGAWSAVLSAAFVTTLGFLPLVFCQHQVLRSLGLSLTLGTLGTVVGSVWGIPSAARGFKFARSVGRPV